MFSGCNFLHTLSAFIVRFAITGVIGSIPPRIGLKEWGLAVSASRAAALSFCLLIAFRFAGEIVPRLFSVDIAPFAAAGSLVVFLLAIAVKRFTSNTTQLLETLSGKGA